MNQDSEPNSDKQVNSSDYSIRPARKWRKLVTTVALLLLGSTGLGLLYGWYFVQRKLIPLIETEAGNYLHRPLELGKMKSFTLTQASFGNSALPATEDNPDFVEVQSVKINLAPLHFLRRRELKLDLILVEPDVYIEQDSSKLWTPTDFGSDSDSEGGIKVDLKSIQLKGGQLSLVAFNSQTDSLNPAVIAELDRVNIRPQDNAIQFDAIAQLIRGGKFTVDGKGYSDTGIIDLDIIGQQLKASEVSNLLALPIEFGRGDLDGKLGITLKGDPLPELQGELDINDVSLQIPGLVKPFSGSQGKLKFQGSKIELGRITTNFGQVSGVASGALDLSDTGDYQINTQVEPIAAQKVVDALELDAPVSIEGKIKGNVAVRGSLEAPVVEFDLASTTPTRIDKVDFKQIDADLELIGTTLNIRQFTSLPKGGGTITGNGKLELDGLQNLAFNVRASGVEAEAIARNYNKLPVDIGKVSGQTNISAQAGDLSTLRFADGDASFDLGNGTVEVDNLDYGKGIWSSQLTARGVEFGSLPIGKGSADTIAAGLVDGIFDVTGTSDLGNLSEVDATGQASLSTVGGKIAIPQINLAQGSWRADAETAEFKASAAICRFARRI